MVMALERWEAALKYLVKRLVMIRKLLSGNDDFEKLCVKAGLTRIFRSILPFIAF